jgi:arylsulfatase A-like enzyme
MGGLSKPATLAACVLSVGVLLFLLNLFVPPWRTEIPLVVLEVPATSRKVEAIPAKGGSAAGRSVLLVTIDTVRPDRLGYHGNQQIDTPTLDQLAREGVIFSRAVATASSTLPTHASILTGLYPHRHGAPANGAFHLNDDVVTLSARLSDEGYETAAFVSVFVLDAQFRLSRGFEHYDDEASEAGAEFAYPERRADRTADRAIGWLRKSRAHPFFLWVHFFDPHADYEPPQEYDRYPTSYDGELAFTDAQLGRIVDAARKAADDNLLIAVTADHGEAFGEQGEETHSILVQEATLRIPLILQPIPPELDGIDLTEAPDPDRAIMAETIEAQVSFGWARLPALYLGRWKLVDGPNPELYDLEDDPLARENLSAKRPEDVARLRAALHALRPNASAQARQSHALSREDKRRLEALGYAGPASGSSPSSELGIDPSSMMPLLTHLDRIANLPDGKVSLATRLSALREGIWLPARGQGVIGLVEEFAERHPNFAPAYLYLQVMRWNETRGLPSETAKPHAKEPLLMAATHRRQRARSGARPTAREPQSGPSTQGRIGTTRRSSQSFVPRWKLHPPTVPAVSLVALSSHASICQAAGSADPSAHTFARISVRAPVSPTWIRKRYQTIPELGSPMRMRPVYS